MQKHQKAMLQTLSCKKKLPRSSYYHPPLQGKSVRPLCAVQNSVTALRYIFYHDPLQKSIKFWNILLYYVNMYYRSLHKKRDSDIKPLSPFTFCPQTFYLPLLPI